MSDGINHYLRPRYFVPVITWPRGPSTYLVTRVSSNRLLGRSGGRPRSSRRGRCRKRSRPGTLPGNEEALQTPSPLTPPAQKCRPPRPRSSSRGCQPGLWAALSEANGVSAGGNLFVSRSRSPSVQTTGTDTPHPPASASFTHSFPRCFSLPLPNEFSGQGCSETASKIGLQPLAESASLDGPPDQVRHVEFIQNQSPDHVPVGPQCLESGRRHYLGQPRSL